ncbi:MAG: class I SAM-dependent methyltransferase [Planctomycetota bacterium]|jgi:ubiquinone/menaquinone biosynthesis C-methylase UbiE
MEEHLKKVASHHDVWAESYDTDYFDRFPLYHRITWDNIARFLPEQKGALVLDAGGGTGIHSLELLKRGYRVVLTDISEGMLNKAREKMKAEGFTDRIEIRTLDVRRMRPFPDNNFAMVLCEGDVFSYCGDHEEALAEVVRVLAPGGTVVASVDNRLKALNWHRDREDPEAVERLLERGETFMPGKEEESPFPVHAFTPQALRSFFESQGLVVERVIGKTVLVHRLPWFLSGGPEREAWLFDLERKWNSDPAFLPWAGHLEIAGRKPKSARSSCVTKG